MKKAFLVLVFLAVCGNAYSAELLIQAKPHWMDSLTEKEVAEMDKSTRQSYEARSNVGDVIAVRPDGWAWGKEEGLPNYVVVKVPMTVEEAQKYEEQLTETVQNEILVEGKAETVTTQVLKRRRKYAIPDVYVSTAKTAEKTDISIASKDVTVFKSAITEKVGLSTEVKPPVKDTIKTDLQSFYKKHLQKYVSAARTFWVENAWAATQLKKTVCPSGCDYTALETCMNANEQNLVTADQYFDVEISGEWSSADGTVVVLHNYTTDATRYINIYTTGDARHSGVWSTTAYRIVYVGSSHGVSAGTQYTTIDGVQVSGMYSGNGGIASTTGNQTIKNNIVKGTNDGPGTSISVSQSVAGARYIFNNIIYGQRNGVIGINMGYVATTYVYNNTVYLTGSSTVGIQRDNGSNYAYNNLSIAATAFNGTFTEADYNASSGETAAGDNSIHNITSDIFTSVTSGSEDFSLESDADVINKGTTLGNPFNADIIATSRPQGAAYDIGAYEYVISGAPPQIF